MGHGFTQSACPPCIVLTDANAGYNTLHVYTNAFNQTLGNLTAQDLLGHGYVTVGAFENTTVFGPLYVNNLGAIGYDQSTNRVKENIRELPDCSWLYNLRPVIFDWKDNRRARLEGTRMGLVAEEVNEQCPQLTWLDSEGKPEGVHYEWLGIPLLVELKKLHNQIDILQTQVQTLTRKIAS